MIEEIICSSDVTKQGLSFLERLFKNKRVHESLIALLKGAVKDERFVQDSKGFGLNWIGRTITDDKCKDTFKSLVVETFIKD